MTEKNQTNKQKKQNKQTDLKGQHNLMLFYFNTRWTLPPV